ncbi:hypothetical protein K438DRAFT_1779189 [Mycena galopus ATCC 62051]|nr:hypothetical protein K438DRAFT_1779189 [Mycena galopus ATCC 62051]
MACEDGISSLGVRSAVRRELKGSVRRIGIAFVCDSQRARDKTRGHCEQNPKPELHNGTEWEGLCTVKTLRFIYPCEELRLRTSPIKQMFHLTIQERRQTEGVVPGAAGLRGQSPEERIETEARRVSSLAPSPTRDQFCHLRLVRDGGLGWWPDAELEEYGWYLGLSCGSGMGLDLVSEATAVVE